MRIENCDFAGFLLKSDVSLVNDTIVDVANGLGICIEDCNPVFSDVYVEWANNVLLSDDITVNDGVTVNIGSGTTTTVDAAAPDPVDLVVYGALVFSGTGSRPEFRSDGGSAGDWNGVTIGGGSSVDWGNGCLISDALNGVTVEDRASAIVIEGVRIENAENAGFLVESDNVTLLNDTVVGIEEGYGIYIDEVSPTLTSCVVEDCEYGIYAYESAATIENCRVQGSGAYGIFVGKALISPGAGVLTLDADTAAGYFSSALLYAGIKGHCDISDCGFTGGPDGGGTYPPYGLMAYDYADVNMRQSRISGYTTRGFYSHESDANLGSTKFDPGDNHIEIAEGGMPLWQYAMHFSEFFTSMPAEYNWWGTSSPSSTRFLNVDYTPYRYTPPAKIFRAGEQCSPPPSEFSVTGNYPNPFNRSTVIGFNLPEPGKARIEVFNMLGQRVRVLVDREYPAGQHEVIWDGTDGRGRTMASGVYLMRVTTADNAETKKMVLLK